MKITNKIRAEILDAVEAEKITPQVEALRARVDAVVQRLAENLYDKKTIAWMKAGPTIAFHKMTHAHPTVNEDRWEHELLKPMREYRRNRYHIDYDTKLNPQVLVLAVDMHHTALAVDIKAGVEIVSITRELDKLQVHRDGMLGTLRQAVYAVNTSKQMQDRYPSLLKYMPKEAGVANMLALTDDKVQQVLG